ncbi:uncharacterized protein LOC131638715 [Vicia villosa]|uniref:uncharacterized protein LOC131638715 n=1 Tax=Vicia villosa TaxID=3911 RepID=UPI00273A92DF|nr:uncharacterized protein LOC131638715 [Vicia villosa]
MIDITDRERKLDKSNVSNDSKSLSESNVTKNVLTTYEDIVKLPLFPIRLQTANIPVGPSRYLVRLNCSDSSHKRDTSFVSKSFRMSQQSCDASRVSDSATPDESSNPNRSLKVVPLRTVSSDKGCTIEELTNEGTRYVDKEITRTVTRILKENHQVPGIFVPLQTIMHDPFKNTSKAEVAHTSGCDPAEEKIIKIGQGGAKNTNVTEDVNDIEENKHTKVNTEIEAKSTVKNSIKKKSTSTGPIKSRAVAKSVGVGPSKSWSKVVPKKIKEREIVESESDVEGDVPNIPSRKNLTTSKLATSIPEIPIYNVSFHYASSAIRWKYVLQKRLVVERELTPNAVENKEILELIQEDGLLKTVCNLPKLYERLVKEFVVNLSEDCGNSKSVDFIKVFVRGKCVSFSPSVINNFLARTNEAQPKLEVIDNKVCQVITTKQVKSWPLKKKLTARAKAKFDYGTYIFDQTMKHAGSFNGTHVPDIVMTSAEASKSGASARKSEVIAILKETCKELEARKISLEKMISTLEMDEDEEFADVVEMEDEDEQEKEVEPEEELEEESASPADGSEKESYADTSRGSDSVQ